MKTQCTEETAVVTPLCDLDMPEVVNVRNTLTTLLQRGCAHIVLDFSRVGHINATGLGILAESVRRARWQKGDVVLTGLNPILHSVFELTGMAKMFRIYNDREAALGAMRVDKVMAA
ncbi:MAG: STAS domain-containing protein [candidate division FCPU426 bacterium]